MPPRTPQVRALELNGLETLARRAAHEARPFREDEVSPVAVLALVQALREREAEREQLMRLHAQELAFDLLRRL